LSENIFLEGFFLIFLGEYLGGLGTGLWSFGRKGGYREDKSRKK